MIVTSFAFFLPLNLVALGGNKFKILTMRFTRTNIFYMEVFDHARARIRYANIIAIRASVSNDIVANLTGLKTATYFRYTCSVLGVLVFDSVAENIPIYDIN